jgi:hypothetical protein
VARSIRCSREYTWKSDFSAFLTDEGITPAEFGRRVEERGFAAIFMAERTHIPPSSGQHARAICPASTTRSLDPFVALSTTAAITQSIPTVPWRTVPRTGRSNWRSAPFGHAPGGQPPSALVHPTHHPDTHRAGSHPRHSFASGHALDGQIRRTSAMRRTIAATAAPKAWLAAWQGRIGSTCG